VGAIHHPSDGHPPASCLEDFSIDIGLTYLDNEPIEGMRAERIYMERYCLLLQAGHPLADAGSV